MPSGDFLKPSFFLHLSVGFLLQGNNVLFLPLIFSFTYLCVVDSWIHVLFNGLQSVAIIFCLFVCFHAQITLDLASGAITLSSLIFGMSPLSPEYFLAC